MSWFMRRSADGLAKATSKVSTGPVSAGAQDTAVFGLEPVRLSCRFDALLFRYMEIGARGEEDPWESVHLLLM